jgi:glucosamine--fructose-6-phosphate aminotransferase (isomerizing)
VRIQCESDLASEWRDRNPILRDDTLVVGLSHSGEDEDTLEALRLARDRDAWTVAITEKPASLLASEADGMLATHAGAESGAAETKAFTAQSALVLLFALALAEARGGLAPQPAAAIRRELETVPGTIAASLFARAHIEEIAAKHQASSFFLYLGRHLGLPVCLEGALKLKEIAGIPTDAYAAGEMKHGPIALLDETTPVVCIATDGHVYRKVVSNMQEVRARGARVVAVANEGNDRIRDHADEVVFVARTHPFLQPLVSVVPLQLFAYRLAALRTPAVETLGDLMPTGAAS